MLIFAIPQSLPEQDKNCSASLIFKVNILDDKPCGTLFCMAIASSIVEYFMMYRIGAKVSCCTICNSLVTSAIQGCT